MLSVQTLTYNCPACKAGYLRIIEINGVLFEAKIKDTDPVKISITGIAKCSNCNAEYEMRGKDCSNIQL